MDLMGSQWPKSLLSFLTLGHQPWHGRNIAKTRRGKTLGPWRSNLRSRLQMRMFSFHRKPRFVFTSFHATTRCLFCFLLQLFHCTLCMSYAPSLLCGSQIDRNLKIQRRHFDSDLDPKKHSPNMEFSPAPHTLLASKPCTLVASVPKTCNFQETMSPLRMPVLQGYGKGVPGRTEYDRTCTTDLKQGKYPRTPLGTERMM